MHLVAEPAPSATALLSRAINILLAQARDLLGRLGAARAHATTAHLPRRFARNPQAAEQRIDRTFGWIIALARTLAGDTFYLPPFRLPRLPGLQPFPPLTAALRAASGLPPRPPITPAQREAAHHRYRARILATQPTGRIAHRLARRLGLTQQSDAWPTALIAITATPAAHAASTNTAPHRTPREPPQPPPPAAPVAPQAADAPAFHPRE